MTESEQLVLAVDGGQTHSMAVLARSDGTVLGAGKGGPANHFLELGGPERFTLSMRTCIEGAFSNAGLRPGPVCASHYGLTGVHEQMEQILQGIAPSRHQSVQPDRLASLWGATQERPAVLILSGTGAIAYGIAADGREAVTGGWGYYMGDEGSASWIAPQALSAATRALDGRGVTTLLSSEIPAYFGVATLHQLHPLIYTHQLDRVKLAEIASVVSQCAIAGDTVSIKILGEAAQHLADAVIAVIKQLGLQDTSVTISSAGGVFKAGAMLIDPMMSAVQRSYPDAAYVVPRYPPVIGALLLGIDSCGCPIDDKVHAAIQSTSSIWKSIK